MVMADRVLAYLRKPLNWHAARDDEFVVPIVRGMAQTQPREQARDRILTGDEIRAIWNQLAFISSRFSCRDDMHSFGSETALLFPGSAVEAIWRLYPARRALPMPCGDRFGSLHIVESHKFLAGHLGTITK